MAFDYKKEYKEFYLPPSKPGIIEIPTMNFLAVRGEGDPNEENGAYGKALEKLYGVAWTIKMSHKSSHKVEGFFEYVVPPLEGFWWKSGDPGEMDYARKDDFHWISDLRLPEFVTPHDVVWTVAEASRKKKIDCSPVEFFTYNEGLCVQCMHLGAFDDEPATVQAMERFAAENGYAVRITPTRYHHEIYLGDPRKTEPGKRKTVIRHPVDKV
jgi:hypothetical protein